METMLSGQPLIMPFPTAMEVLRCRLVEAMPSPIVCMTLCGTVESDDSKGIDGGKRRRLVAFARANGVVEFWCEVNEGTADAWCQIFFLPAIVNETPQCLTHAVVNNEAFLFIGYLSGRIRALRLLEDTSVSATSFGGSCWGLCTTADQSCIVAACEDGYLRVFDLSSNGTLGLRTSIAAHAKRALAVASHPQEASIIASAGFDGAIKITNWLTSTILSSFLVGRPEDAVWSVAFSRNGSWVFGGDASGKTHIINVVDSVIEASLMTNEADVSALASLTVQGSVGLVACGRDGKQSVLRRGPKRIWQICSTSRPHSHDINAVCVVDNSVILTAGNDSLLVATPTQKHVHSSQSKHSHPSKSNNKHPLNNSQNNPPPSKKKQLTNAAVHPNGMSPVWKSSPFPSGPYAWASLAYNMPSSPSSAVDCQWRVLCRGADPFVLHLLQSSGTSTPQRSMEIKVHPDHSLACFAISPNGQLILLASLRSSRLYQVSADGRSMDLISVGPAVRSLCFTPDSERLILSITDGSLVVTSSTNLDEVLAAFAVKFTSCLPTVLACSPDGEFLAVIRTFGLVEIYSLDTLSKVSSIPGLSSPPVSVSVAGAEGLVGVLCASGTFHLWDIAARKLLDCTQSLSLKKTLPPARTAQFIPGRKTGVLATWDSSLVSFDFAGFRSGRSSHEKEKGSESMVKKRKRSSEASTGAEVQMKAASTLQQIIFTGFVGQERLLVLERPWLQVLRDLPAPVYRHRFGT